jgi:hypothetical protein
LNINYEFNFSFLIVHFSFLKDRWQSGYIISGSQINLMIKNILNFFLFSCVVSITFCGCKKSSQPIHYVISDEIKQWYLYQKGSYWIYQNENTLQIDSTSISKDPSFWQDNFYKDDGSLGAITDHIDISYDGNVLQTCNITPGEVEISTREAGYHKIAFLSNIEEGKKLILSEYTYEYIHHYDSLAIYNQYFHDVRQTRFSSSLNSNGTDSLALNLFFARHIGLIKLTQSRSGTDTTWSVIRYHPIQ